MRWILAALSTLFVATPFASSGNRDVAAKKPAAKPFTETFGEDNADLGPNGTNPYFVLEPGYVLELAGKENDEDVKITITVTDETKKIDGVETRVVVEKEWAGDNLKESTRDYFAISKRTNNVYYFGEEVDEYKDGKVAGHGGSWISGEKDAHYGLIMMATPILGARYYQERAPGVGMDRAEVVSLTETFDCDAGTFGNVLKTVETSPLEKGVKEEKLYARGVGIVSDGPVKLVKYGKPEKK